MFIFFLYKVLNNVKGFLQPHVFANHALVRLPGRSVARR
jgi:hypothetical protein